MMVLAVAVSSGGTGTNVAISLSCPRGTLSLSLSSLGMERIGGASPSAMSVAFFFLTFQTFGRFIGGSSLSSSSRKVGVLLL